MLKRAASEAKVKSADMLRIVYFGSSDFSIPGLRACLEVTGYEVAAVITTPPQRQGRGLTLTSTVVAQFCAYKEIKYFEYAKLDEDALAQIAAFNPEVFVVASYGKIIPESFLKLAKIRLNIHPSLLPKYRGASPLNGPILAGDLTTGLSIADITKSLDAGEVYFQEEVPLTPSADSESMGTILAEKSYLALQDLLEQAKNGKIRGVPQNHSNSSYAPKLSKEDGRLFFNVAAEKWDRVVRGLKPWPGAFTEIHDERLGLISVRIKKIEPALATGIIHEITAEGLVVQTARDCIELLQVKPAGKSNMSGADYARGRRWKTGMLLQ